jgi:Ca2+-binding RTX toxin-like protein
MTILTVGPGLQFQTVAAAVAASHDGDTLYVQAGTYLNDGATINTKISIVGVGGLAHFVSNTPIANGKAIFVTNTDVKFDHVEFSGAQVPDGNGAGIRYQGGHLTITNSYFHDNQDGILGAASSGGIITIDASEFAHNGKGDGQTHNIYIGAISNFTITHSYIHDAVVGHEIKSRAATTTIENNRIFDNSGTASYSIDLPNGGVAVVSHNVIQQGINSQNSRIVAYGAEGGLFANSSLRVDGNTVSNELTRNPIFVANFAANLTAGAVAITNNHLFGITAAQIAIGPHTSTGNTTLSAKPTLDSSHPEAASAWDHIVWAPGTANVLSGSAARDLVVGSAGSDTLKGGLGRDTLIGGTGADSFNFKLTTESPKGVNHDTIADFSGHGREGDHINVRGIDANSHAAHNQNFHFIGAQSFHRKAGELHFVKHGTFVSVEGDVNGDGRADFQIDVHNLAANLNSLTLGDFVL